MTGVSYDFWGKTAVDDGAELLDDVQGTVGAVQRWVDAIRTGDMLPLDGAA